MPASSSLRVWPGLRRGVEWLVRRRAAIAVAGLAAWFAIACYNTRRPLPPGVSVLGSLHPAPDIEFLYDLTYVRDSDTTVEQEIFARVFEMIDAADAYIVLDMFLFNSEHAGDRPYLPLADRLTNLLIDRKQRDPALRVSFTTDEINNFYGAYTSEQIARLRAADVEVVITDLTKLRDSNPGYSAVWRVLLQWFGTRGIDLLPHPLSSTGQKVTARSYLKLFNMKANHRKLLVTDKGCLLASANPHDASGFHSNIAWAASGPVCHDVLASEVGVAAFSGSTGPSRAGAPDAEALGAREPAGPDLVPDVPLARFVSEGKIRQRLLEELQASTRGDTIDVAMFYLSDRRVVRGLAGAASHGAVLRVILDPNKDAFGRQKGGIPNRQVAHELHGRYRTEVRWYDTHGEQFHTKLVVFRRPAQVTMFGGSANLTRRNIGDYNLEADLEVRAQRDAAVVQRVFRYFDRIWSDDGGYTVAYDVYADESRLKRLIYRFQEATGLASF